ncbi:hypothetical protein PLANPX_6095 [Lacipirellula parvula]|uniref:Uncharacterized protein n=1 Tax=Lacipirellula parvula TaxID=2650471 RepID=A0A5K7XNN2_9BACT|nr:hypothetical protein PLANPX_6095 [Lacipirellula parvula]
MNAPRRNLAQRSLSSPTGFAGDFFPGIPPEFFVRAAGAILPSATIR